MTSRWIRTIEPDNEGAGRAAARLLHGRGARRFAYIGAESSASAAREKGFRDVLCDLGVAEIIVYTSNLDHSGGYAAGLALVARRVDRTGYSA